MKRAAACYLPSSMVFLRLRGGAAQATCSGPSAAHNWVAANATEFIQTGPVTSVGLTLAPPRLP